MKITKLDLITDAASILAFYNEIEKEITDFIRLNIFRYDSKSYLNLNLPKPFIKKYQARIIRNNDFTFDIFVLDKLFMKFDFPNQFIILNGIDRQIESIIEHNNTNIDSLNKRIDHINIKKEENRKSLDRIKKSIVSMSNKIIEIENLNKFKKLVLTKILEEEKIQIVNYLNVLDANRENYIKEYNDLLDTEKFLNEELNELKCFVETINLIRDNEYFIKQLDNFSNLVRNQFNIDLEIKNEESGMRYE